jgi:hypothetical protein
MEQRMEAWHQLEIAIATDFDRVVLALSNIIVNQELGDFMHCEAGQQLIGIMYSSESQEMTFNRNRWFDLPWATRDQIKFNCLEALAMSYNGTSWAALCVTRVACMELPAGNWPELLDLLGAQITDTTTPQSLKDNYLLVIEKMCEFTVRIHFLINIIIFN